MTKIVRVVCIWTEAEKPDEDRLTFDVFVDDEMVAQRKFMTFGYMGSAKENAERFFPFGLRTSGELANGSDSGEPDDTKETLNPFGKKMVPGEFLTFSVDRDDYTYRIAQVIDLVEGHK